MRVFPVLFHRFKSKQTSSYTCRHRPVARADTFQYSAPVHLFLFLNMWDWQYRDKRKTQCHGESWHCMKTGSVAWQDKLSQLLNLWLYCMAFVSWCRPTYYAEHITVNHHVVGLHVGQYTYWPWHMDCVWWNGRWHILSCIKWCVGWAGCQLHLAYILYINKRAWLWIYSTNTF